MRRHLENHPSFSRSSEANYPNSLRLYAADSTNSPPRIAYDLTLPRKNLESNIPMATPPSSISSIPSASFHHSRGTIKDPFSPCTGSNTNNSDVLRHLLTSVQQTGQAVDTGPTSEVETGVQSSLNSVYQVRVAAAATTLSQPGLGQNSSSIHRSFKAHRNTHIAPPVQANIQAHGTQVQEHQNKKLKVEDALLYLDKVKYKLSNEPHVYSDFLDTMRQFKSKSLGTTGVIQHVSKLFRGHTELIIGFNAFLPLGYRIEILPQNEV